jgi:hypothetical protein
VLGRDNAVVIVFSGVDLTLFSRVEAKLGADVRDSVANPDDVVVVSATELRLKFGDTSETGRLYWEIVGFDGVNTDGLELTSECLDNLYASEIC